MLSNFLADMSQRQIWLEPETQSVSSLEVEEEEDNDSYTSGSSGESDDGSETSGSSQEDQEEAQQPKRYSRQQRVKTQQQQQQAEQEDTQPLAPVISSLRKARASAPNLAGRSLDFVSHQKTANFSGSKKAQDDPRDTNSNLRNPAKTGGGGGGVGGGGMKQGNATWNISSGAKKAGLDLLKDARIGSALKGSSPSITSVGLKTHVLDVSLDRNEHQSTRGDNTSAGAPLKATVNVTTVSVSIEAPPGTTNKELKAKLKKNMTPNPELARFRRSTTGPIVIGSSSSSRNSKGRRRIRSANDKVDGNAPMSNFRRTNSAPVSLMMKDRRWNSNSSFLPPDQDHNMNTAAETKTASTQKIPSSIRLVSPQSSANAGTADNLTTQQVVSRMKEKRSKKFPRASAPNLRGMASSYQQHQAATPDARDSAPTSNCRWSSSSNLATPSRRLMGRDPAASITSTESRPNIPGASAPNLLALARGQPAVLGLHNNNHQSTTTTTTNSGISRWSNSSPTSSGKVAVETPVTASAGDNTTESPTMELLRRRSGSRARLSQSNIGSSAPNLFQILAAAQQGSSSNAEWKPSSGVGASPVGKPILSGASSVFQGMEPSSQLLAAVQKNRANQTTAAKMGVSAPNLFGMKRSPGFPLAAGGAAANAQWQQQGSNTKAAVKPTTTTMTLLERIAQKRSGNQGQPTTVGIQPPANVTEASNVVQERIQLQRGVSRTSSRMVMSTSSSKGFGVSAPNLSMRRLNTVPPQTGSKNAQWTPQVVANRAGSTASSLWNSVGQGSSREPRVAESSANIPMVTNSMRRMRSIGVSSPNLAGLQRAKTVADPSQAKEEMNQFAASNIVNTRGPSDIQRGIQRTSSRMVMSTSSNKLTGFGVSAPNLHSMRRLNTVPTQADSKNKQWNPQAKANRTGSSAASLWNSVGAGSSLGQRGSERGIDQSMMASSLRRMRGIGASSPNISGLQRATTVADPSQAKEEMNLLANTSIMVPGGSAELKRGVQRTSSRMVMSTSSNKLSGIGVSAPNLQSMRRLNTLPSRGGSKNAQWTPQVMGNRTGSSAASLWNSVGADSSMEQKGSERGMSQSMVTNSTRRMRSIGSSSPNIGGLQRATTVANPSQAKEEINQLAASNMANTTRGPDVQRGVQRTSSRMVMSTSSNKLSGIGVSAPNLHTMRRLNTLPSKSGSKNAQWTPQVVGNRTGSSAASLWNSVGADSSMEQKGSERGMSHSMVTNSTRRMRSIGSSSPNINGLQRATTVADPSQAKDEVATVTSNAMAAWGASEIKRGVQRTSSRMVMSTSSSKLSGIGVSAPNLNNMAGQTMNPSSANAQWNHQVAASRTGSSAASLWNSVGAGTEQRVSDGSANLQMVANRARRMRGIGLPSPNLNGLQRATTVADPSLVTEEMNQLVSSGRMMAAGDPADPQRGVQRTSSRMVMSTSSNKLSGIGVSAPNLPSMKGYAASSNSSPANAQWTQSVSRDSRFRGLGGVSALSSLQQPGGNRMASSGKLRSIGVSAPHLQNMLVASSMPQSSCSNAQWDSRPTLMSVVGNGSPLLQQAVERTNSRAFASKNTGNLGGIGVSAPNLAGMSRLSTFPARTAQNTQWSKAAAPALSMQPMVTSAKPVPSLSVAESRWNSASNFDGRSGASSSNTSGPKPAGKRVSLLNPMTARRNPSSQAQSKFSRFGASAPDLMNLKRVKMATRDQGLSNSEWTPNSSSRKKQLASSMMGTQLGLGAMLAMEKTAVPSSRWETGSAGSLSDIDQWSTTKQLPKKPPKSSRRKKKKHGKRSKKQRKDSAPPKIRRAPTDEDLMVAEEANNNDNTPAPSDAPPQKVERSSTSESVQKRELVNEVAGLVQDVTDFVTAELQAHAEAGDSSVAQATASIAALEITRCARMALRKERSDRSLGKHSSSSHHGEADLDHSNPSCLGCTETIPEYPHTSDESVDTASEAYDDFQEGFLPGIDYHSHSHSHGHEVGHEVEMLGGIDEEVDNGIVESSHVHDHHHDHGQNELGYVRCSFEGCDKILRAPVRHSSGASERRSSIGEDEEVAAVLESMASRKTVSGGPSKPMRRGSVSTDDGLPIGLPGLQAFGVEQKSNERNAEKTSSRSTTANRLPKRKPSIDSTSSAPFNPPFSTVRGDSLSIPDDDCSEVTAPSVCNPSGRNLVSNRKSEAGEVPPSPGRLGALTKLMPDLHVTSFQAVPLGIASKTDKSIASADMLKPNPFVMGDGSNSTRRSSGASLNLLKQGGIPMGDGSNLTNRTRRSSGGSLFEDITDGVLSMIATGACNQPNPTELHGMNGRAVEATEQIESDFKESTAQDSGESTCEDPAQDSGEESGEATGTRPRPLFAIDGAGSRTAIGQAQTKPTPLFDIDAWRTGASSEESKPKPLFEIGTSSAAEDQKPKPLFSIDTTDVAGAATPKPKPLFAIDSSEGEDKKEEDANTGIARKPKPLFAIEPAATATKPKPLFSIETKGTGDAGNPKPAPLFAIDARAEEDKQSMDTAKATTPKPPSAMAKPDNDVEKATTPPPLFSIEMTDATDAVTPKSTPLFAIDTSVEHDKQRTDAATTGTPKPLFAIATPDDDSDNAPKTKPLFSIEMAGATETAMPKPKPLFAIDTGGGDDNAAALATSGSGRSHPTRRQSAESPVRSRE